MNPAHVSDRPGKAPDGMDLVPVYADETGAAGDQTWPAGTVRINPLKQQLIGVTTTEVAVQPLTSTLRTVAQITYDETRIARVHAKVEGWIEQVFVDFVGKEVRKGQPLLTLYSPELVATQQELLIAKKARDSLQNARFPEIASGSLRLYEATLQRLKLWDISEQEIRDIEERGKPATTMTLFAPVSGFVVERNAFARQRINPDTELYRIVDLSRVWALAEIYEYEVPMIRLGQPARLTLSYLPGHVFNGRVSYVYPQLSGATRTLRVRLEFDNPRLQLKPDMFANVELRIDYGRHIAVPEEAILDSGSEQIVFVAHEGGYFEPRSVQVGPRVGRLYAILTGLKSGEKVVTSGNFLIDSESRLKSAIGAMTGPGSHEGHGLVPAQPPAETSGPSPEHSQEHPRQR